MAPNGQASHEQATRKRWPYYTRPLSSPGTGCDVYSRATSCGWPARGWPACR